MNNEWDMYDASCGGKKRPPLSDDAKHTIGIAIGGLLTTNIISVAALVILQSCGLEPGLSIFFGVLAVLSAVASLLLAGIIISNKPNVGSEESDGNEPWKAMVCGVVLALAVFMFALARLVMLLQRAQG